MLVFRCECEHVLGVENESSRGRAGECPSCGRIIRVPPVLIDATGKLQQAGSPTRASISGALSPIKDTRPDFAATPPAASSSTRMNEPVVKPSAATRAGAPANNANFEASSETLPMEPETLSPLTEHEAAEASLNTLPELPESAGAIAAKNPIPPKEKDVKQPGKFQKGSFKAKAANDPAEAVETRIDKNIATLASAAASSRRRKAGVEPVPAAKKAPVMLYIAIVVLLLAGIGALYAFGIIGGSGKKTPEKPPQATPAAGAKTDLSGAAKTDDKKTPDSATPPDSKLPDAAVPKDDAAKDAAK